MDSGADVSLIPTQLVPSEKLEPYSLSLRAANDTLIQIDGQACLTIRIGKQHLSSTLLASPNVDEVILGRDWLRQNCVVWDFGENQVHINNHPCEIHVRNHEKPRCKHCRVGTDINIPPNGETIIPADIVFGHLNSPSDKGHWTTVPAEPTPGLRVARTLITPDSPTVAIRVCNTTRHTIHLRKGQTMGNLQEVCTVSQPLPPCAERASGSLEALLDKVDPTVPADTKQRLSKLIETYQDVFSMDEFDLGSTKIVQHRIDTGENRPFRQPLRPQPRAQLPVIDELLEDMQQQGVIEPCQSDWASNVVLVKKKDGSIRFCIDYRKLNSLTTKDAYPLPRIDGCLDTLSGAAWYSTFDLRSGFHQVAMDPRDVNKTTFVCHRGTFRFPKMPFGLCNAPATFQRLMDTVLSGLNYEICLAYLDDIIVFSHDLDTHLQRLEQLFIRLREANLKLKPSKCRMLQKRVTFLGYTVSQAGVGTDPDKIAAVRDWPVPHNLRQCRAFVGLCQYYRRFVPNFSGVAAPLHALTKKGARFAWTAEFQASFDKLKEILIGADVLALPNDEGMFVLDCDASDKAIGAVLSQIQNGEERPICYASQLYDKHQRNYNVTRKELLAFVTFAKKFRQYLLGARFLVRTDHAALQWLKRTPEPIGQQARWLETLEEYEYTLEHRPGSRHGNADALSRREESSEPGVADTPAIATITHSEPDVEQNPISWPEVQKSDADLHLVYELVQSGSTQPPEEETTACSADTKTLLAQLASLRLKSDGTLYREWQRKSQTFQQIIVPSALRQTISDQLHRGLNGGHLGRRRARLQLQQRYYWPGCGRDVHQAQMRCDACARYKRPPNPRQGPLQPMVVGEPWERLGIDITGPHPVSAKGNIFILTVIDHFSKWVELFPMRNQEATTVAKVLVDRVICLHGCPLQILTDQGPNFESELFQSICKLLSVDKIRTSAYKPSTNGNIDRFHSTLHAMMAKLVNSNQRDWDERLPVIAFAYRTSVHETTGYTPFFLLFGREARIPADIVYGAPPDDGVRSDSLSEFVDRQQQRLRDAYDQVRQDLKGCAQRRKRQYDLRTRPRTYNVGSWVWCLDPRRRTGRYKKWQSPYCGPFLVTRQRGPVNYEIQLGPRARPRVVHVDKLKECLTPPTNDWSQPAPESSQNVGPSNDTAADTGRPRRAIRRPSRFRDD